MELRSKLEELLKKRFFYAPSFSIYGGVAGLYDYGPHGCALQNNLLSFFRNFFINEEGMLELDPTILTPYEVLKTSGHVDRFTDYMVHDSVTGNAWRADHVLEAHLSSKLANQSLSEAERNETESILALVDNYNADELQLFFDRFNIKAPDTGNSFGKIDKFNLMFGTNIGPTSQLPGFLRPETAQGQAVNFNRLLECNNNRMPFASASIGKSFRNEISPRSGLLRVREFMMAEIEHYVNPNKKDHARFDEIKDSVTLSLLTEASQHSGKPTTVQMTMGGAVSQGIVNNQTLAYFMARTHVFLIKIGIKSENLRFRQHLKNEMAHYACDCWDAEIKTSYGWIECAGLADRSAYDLTMHSVRTGERLVARERLDEPVVVTKTKLDLDKKLIGMTFKHNAKKIIDFLEGLEETALKDLEVDLVKNNGCHSLSLDKEIFSLTQEMIKVKKVSETLHVLEYVPNIIEPSFGIGRIIYSLLENVFWTRTASNDGDESARNVLSFPAFMAPIKAVVLPLSNNAEFTPMVKSILAALREANITCNSDESAASIGKRYARNDEIGVPFGITVDFQTLKDSTVTLRERDSLSQVRISVDDAVKEVSALVSNKTSWNALTEKYGAFTGQEL